MSNASSTAGGDLGEVSDFDEGDFNILEDISPIPVSEWQLLYASTETYRGALMGAPMVSLSVAFTQAAPSLGKVRKRSTSTTSTKAGSERISDSCRSIAEDSFGIQDARSDKYVRKLRGREEKSRQGHLHRVHDIHYCRQCLNRYWPRHFKTCRLCEKAGGRYAWKGQAGEGINAVSYYTRPVEVVDRREGRTRASRWREKMQIEVGK
ncbi:hypothetical protein Pmar_PMAR010011 [Perkinsus marinus ATCC 50983]|uniref:Uncharacterized protein n=1 Tax=Perkinsus marinus (strain ATCC 50983 / TXsc) TaxID=423536 RepID=C5K5I8_PERM5|nr:hypothetical protein Pmar_PMAR010011 [Perkinsus marinus ATCC 50983]EER20250.1 hypothetical protein Pmar_PMAR010011 [Perkinsus marinus ATCC 50983]|eukprot:XP_002788454.1 hypothetical protein Pmar_PMAR010011 [Perkinsus marinus ATCC 50983]